jgi:hypothetical protein
MQLSCDETPLNWPRSASLEDLTICKTCGFILHSPNPGSLQVQTRRAGDGVGDGVNIMEAGDIGLDYRGQRYMFEEAIFHTPGLHIFPGEKEVFPAEYHLHFKTLTAPLRGVSIIIPVSHRVTGIGADYFAAISRQPDPATQRPTLVSILTSGTDILQYLGTDIRGRTEETPTPASCGDTYERQFLLILQPCAIYASDLERIPREGSLSTNPRDLPAPGVKNKHHMPIDRVKRTLVLARPGILGGEPMSTNDGISASTQEVVCKPVKVVDGRDVVDVNGQSVDIMKLLGLGSDGGMDTGIADRSAEDAAQSLLAFVQKFMAGIVFFGALLIAEKIVGITLWRLFFQVPAEGTKYLFETAPIKIWFFAVLAFLYGLNSNNAALF